LKSITTGGYPLSASLDTRSTLG